MGTDDLGTKLLKKIPRITAFLILCRLVVLLLPLVRAHAADWPDISARIGKSDAVAIAAPDGEIIFAKHENEYRVPASTLKILTALVAFDRLGPDYRFPTEFYVDAARNLIIKGYGDPFLVSEQVKTICNTLSGKIDAPNDLVIDSSYFLEPMRIPGAANCSLQPYDAPVGALCVNFNTINFKKEGCRFVSAETQTPLLPVAKRRIESASSGQGRMLLSSEKSELTRYAGEMFRYFLEESGVNIRGEIRTCLLPANAGAPVYRHVSEMTLRQMVPGMLKYSSNFIANQIFLSAGAATYGPPATLEKGVRAAKRYTETLGIDPILVEGSGISRQNRVTAAMFLKILEAFAPYHELMPSEGLIFCKTGTLKGVQTRAGYFRRADGQLYPFVVLINTPGKAADPIVDRLALRLGRK